VAAKARGQETVGDAVRSLVVLGGLVAVVVGVYTIAAPEEQLPPPVDYDHQWQVAGQQYDYPVLAPDPLPSGWRATSVEAESEAIGDRWRLGLLTDAEEYIGLEQNGGEVQGFLFDRLDDFEADGESRVDGKTWQRWYETDDDPHRALVLEGDGVATVVTGSVGYDELEEFVGLLSEAPESG